MKIEESDVLDMLADVSELGDVVGWATFWDYKNKVDDIELFEVLVGIIMGLAGMLGMVMKREPWRLLRELAETGRRMKS